MRTLITAAALVIVFSSCAHTTSSNGKTAYTGTPTDGYDYWVRFHTQADRK